MFSTVKGSGLQDLLKRMEGEEYYEDENSEDDESDSNDDVEESDGEEEDGVHECDADIEGHN